MNVPVNLARTEVPALMVSTDSNVSVHLDGEELLVKKVSFCSISLSGWRSALSILGTLNVLQKVVDLYIKVAVQLTSYIICNILLAVYRSGPGGGALTLGGSIGTYLPQVRSFFLCSRDPPFQALFQLQSLYFYFLKKISRIFSNFD